MTFGANSSATVTGTGVNIVGATGDSLTASNDVIDFSGTATATATMAGSGNVISVAFSAATP